MILYFLLQVATSHALHVRKNARIIFNIKPPSRTPRNMLHRHSIFLPHNYAASSKLTLHWSLPKKLLMVTPVPLLVKDFFDVMACYTDDTSLLIPLTVTR